MIKQLKKQMRRKAMFRAIIYTTLFFCISISQLEAQSFNWSGDIPEIEKEGFYKLLISPDVTSKLENEFRDIRIYDANDKEIPYIFESEKALSFNDYFVEYPIVERKEETGWPYYTRLVIHNKSRTKISNIQLLIRNSDVTKKLKLSGSDDREKWYVIKDSYRFQAMYSDETTSIIKIIDFPLSNYEYFEILIDDWKNNPINILKAGYYNTSIDEGKYSEVASPQVSQLEKEEDKESVVKIVFKGKPQIDKLSVKLEGPEFYFRDAEFQVRDSSLNRSKKYEYYYSTIATVNLNSNSLNTFYLGGVRTGVLYLRIKNNDNEPLAVKEIVAEQLNSYLIAKLKPKTAYKVNFGDDKLNAPNYDFKYFKDEIPRNIPQVKVLNISSIKSSSVQPESQTGIHLDSAFIWIAIVLVVALLLYMVVKMLNDMKQK
jgi:hypothetical protein